MTGQHSSLWPRPAHALTLMSLSSFLSGLPLDSQTGRQQWVVVGVGGGKWGASLRSCSFAPEGLQFGGDITFLRELMSFRF